MITGSLRADGLGEGLDTTAEWPEQQMKRLAKARASVQITAINETRGSTATRKEALL